MIELPPACARTGFWRKPGGRRIIANCDDTVTVLGNFGNGAGLVRDGAGNQLSTGRQGRPGLKWLLTAFNYNDLS